jgi:hypothetical protein
MLKIFGRKRIRSVTVPKGTARWRKRRGRRQNSSGYLPRRPGRSVSNTVRSWSRQSDRSGRSPTSRPASTGSTYTNPSSSGRHAR